MAYIVQAYKILTKKEISCITFGFYHPTAQDFLRLMGVSKAAVRKVYTQAELKQIRKNCVNFIPDIEQRRDIKQFLTQCIDAADDSNIDIWFV